MSSPLIFCFSAISAALTSYILTGLVRAYSHRHKIVAQPRERDVHTKAVPRLGGLAISAGLILTLLIIYLVNPEWLRFTAETRLGVDRSFLGIIIGSVLVTIVGLWDDLVDLKPARQLFFQLIAASVIVFSGIGIDFIRSPWGLIRLDQWTWQLFTFSNYTYTITLLSDIFTLFWLILIMNVVNWLDGLDGLAAGISGIASGMLFILTLLISGNMATAILAIILFGSLIGFLPWNWHPAKIFMGSSGSYLLGYILGILAIVSGGKMATAILVLGLPVFDAFWVAARRIISGHSPFTGDRRHLHHRLIDAGLSVRSAVILLYLVAFVFGTLALVDANAQAKLVLLIWVIAILVILGTISILLEKRNGKM